MSQETLLRIQKTGEGGSCVWKTISVLFLALVLFGSGFLVGRSVYSGAAEGVTEHSDQVRASGSQAAILTESARSGAEALTRGIEELETGIERSAERSRELETRIGNAVESSERTSTGLDRSLEYNSRAREDAAAIERLNREFDRIIRGKDPGSEDMENSGPE